MSLLEYIKTFTNENIGRILRNVEDRIVHLADVAVARTTHHVKKQLISLFFMLLSFLLFSIAAVFFLIEYLNLTKTLSFLLLAFLILIIALILKINY